MNRWRIAVGGRVQGVGFRPFVWRTARALGLSGFVLNDGAGVQIEVQGRDLDPFLEALREIAPPARIDDLAVEVIPSVADDAPFAIRPSGDRPPVGMHLGADLATCEACLAELFDPQNRRYRYPLIACCHCGPRFTMAQALPYDRANTTMAPFPLCTACSAEYADPQDRRFHAEPTTCSTCGPQLSTSLEAVVAGLHTGQVWAIQGLGGFHLVCDARHEAAVTRLRQLKGRDAKPLAVMVASLAAARRLAQVDGAAGPWLTSPQRPIVIVPRRVDPDAAADLAAAVHPGLSHVGLMLPYTPIHYLLFHEAATAVLGRVPLGTAWLDSVDLALVMTSANPSGAAICTTAAAVTALLAVDGVLHHDRAIAAAADDSVMRIVADGPSYLRRSRGAIPDGVSLTDGPPLIAVGAHLKVTVGFAQGPHVTVSPHVGDVDNRATLDFLATTVAHGSRLLGLSPAGIVHDRHPDLLTTRWATEFAAQRGIPTYAVQHHHAHVAAVAAEYRPPLPLVALVLDGYGYGEDGRAWGGELVQLQPDGSARRLGHLAPLGLVGGDRATREIWRLAVAFLVAQGESPTAIAARFAAIPAAEPLAALCAQQQASGSVATTTAAGRLFDLAAALSGLATSRFEADAAVRFEELAAGEAAVVADGWHVTQQTAALPAGCLALTPLLRRFTDRDPQANAREFHGTLAAALMAWAAPFAAAAGQQLALCGGCFHNDLLTRHVRAAGENHGLHLWLPRQFPVGDGAIALGQLWLVRHRLAHGDLTGY